MKPSIQKLRSLQLLGAARQEKRRAEYRKSVLRKMARLGGQLFGPVPDGHRREFFCLDDHTWVWHEEWIDKNGQPRVTTTRYDIRPTGVLKSQGARHYQELTAAETANLRRAMGLYRQQIKSALPELATS